MANNSGRTRVLKAGDRVLVQFEAEVQYVRADFSGPSIAIKPITYTSPAEMVWEMSKVYPDTAWFKPEFLTKIEPPKPEYRAQVESLAAGSVFQVEDLAKTLYAVPDDPNYILPLTGESAGEMWSLDDLEWDNVMNVKVLYDAGADV